MTPFGFRGSRKHALKKWKDELRLLTVASLLSGSKKNVWIVKNTFALREMVTDESFDKNIGPSSERTLSLVIHPNH